MKMRSITLLATTLVLALAVTGCGEGNGNGNTDSTLAAAPAPGSDAVSEAHHHPAEHAAAPVLADGQRWKTDEPLRAAMSRIHDDVSKSLPAFHETRLQAEDADALATAVESNIDYMFSNCKLAPEPDAALHLLIGRMLAASAKLRADPASADGMPQLVAAVNEYQATFDHEGMQPLTHD
ncbi:MAG: hypothetical protein ACOH1V_01445 [Stenotrophomonas sp.]